MTSSINRLTVRASLALFLERTLPFLVDLRDLRAWRRKSHSTPAPWRVKMGVLVRYRFPEGAWIETGTLFGRTTRFLAHSSPEVISLEPSRTHYLWSKRRLRSLKNIHLRHETSEEGLEPSLSLLRCDRVNFWLDGHYSEAGTFLGNTETPIRVELATIKKWLDADTKRKASVFIDDVRQFRSLASLETRLLETQSYPALSELVEWASSAGMSWIIEHDIFIAKSEPEPEP